MSSEGKRSGAAGAERGCGESPAPVRGDGCAEPLHTEGTGTPKPGV